MVPPKWRQAGALGQASLCPVSAWVSPKAPLPCAGPGTGPGPAHPPGGGAEATLEEPGGGGGPQEGQAGPGKGGGVPLAERRVLRLGPGCLWH